ncbi:TetR/AcrR family transcriptional regulator, partial [Dellaglioa algida]
MKKKDDSKITKILDSAVTIILTEGVAALSTTKIAKMMGIAQSNIYLYFKNKDDLLKNIYHREFERIRQISDLEKLNDRTILVNERIDYYIHSVFDYAIAYPNSLTVIEQIK